MAQEIISQKVKRTCDGCGEEKEYEYVGMAEKPEVIADLENWFSVIREVWNGREWIKMIAQAYGLDCVSKATVKMEIMIQQQRQRESAQEKETDQIDLGALRVN